MLRYLLKTLYSIDSMNALLPLLFSNVALMTLIGFNAHQATHGLTRRGDARCRLHPKRGPLSPQSLAQNICKLGVTQMAPFFDGIVRLIVALGLVKGDVTVALDGSNVLTPGPYEGCGCVSVTRRATEAETKRRVKIIETLFGWKVLVLIDVQTRLPLALHVRQIQEYEGQWLLPLVRRAQDNLGTAARIVTIVVDRGYLDGEDLWAFAQMGLTFIIVAKENMAVVADARALAIAGDGYPAERVEIIRHGRGHNQTHETRRTRVVGVADLTSYDDYGDAEHGRQHLRIDFVGHPINAVVVLEWGTHVYPQGGTVYLTNGPVDNHSWHSIPMTRAARSRTASSKKEGKYPWHLERFPQRTEAAVVVQCYFTLLVMALCTAFRLWQATQEMGAEGAATSALLAGEGTQRWRRRLKEENRDKVIAFIGACYGIFHIAELAVLAGLRLKSAPSWLGSPQDIFARYGLGP